MYTQGSLWRRWIVQHESRRIVIRMGLEMPVTSVRAKVHTILTVTGFVMKKIIVVMSLTLTRWTAMVTALGMCVHLLF